MTATNTEPKITIPQKLSLLWIFAMFNYLYADVMGLMDSEILKGFLKGEVEGMEITESLLFGGAILMETAILMIVLSRLLKYRANRWANIVFGAVHTLAVFSSMFVGEGPSLYYLFFGTIEIACTSYIVWLAWGWKES